MKNQTKKIIVSFTEFSKVWSADQHLIRQVLATEFDDCPPRVAAQIANRLIDSPHSLASRALEHLFSASAPHHPA
jgi:hypothetical protein